jgi:alpha-mannosidase
MQARETIHVVPSFHYDVAYLQTCAAYLPRSYAILDAALDILDRDPDYRFTVEQVYLLERYWEDRPDRREALRRHAASGRLECVPGAFVLADMNLPPGEALFQQIRIGRRWLRDTLGVEPEVYYNPDDWGHPPQLPQVLAQCGYTSYVFWRCMRRDVLRAAFLWEGLDGTRLPAHWLARSYSNLSFPDTAERLNAAELSFAEAGTRQIRDLLDGLRRHGDGPDWLMLNGGDFRHPQASAPEALRRLNALPACGCRGTA